MASGARHAFLENFGQEKSEKSNKKKKEKKNTKKNRKNEKIVQKGKNNRFLSVEKSFKSKKKHDKIQKMGKVPKSNYVFFLKKKVRVRVFDVSCTVLLGSFCVTVVGCGP